MKQIKTLKLVNIFLVKWPVLRTFMLATVTNFIPKKCQLKIRYYKLMPSLAFGLVTVAVPTSIVAGQSCFCPCRILSPHN